MRKLAKNSTKPVISLVVAHGGRLTTTSLVIADLFGRRHFDVVKTIKRLSERGKINEISRSSFTYQDSQNREQVAYELDERSFLIAMPFIGGNKAEDGQVALVDAFLRMRKELEHINKQKYEPAWKAIRDDTKSGFRWMNANLKEKRERDGKETTNVHYMSEAKLINGVLTGNFSGVDRDKLSETDLNMLAELQRANANMIAMDIEYKVRKQKLQEHLSTRLRRELAR